MKKPRFQENVSCEVIAKHFTVFQQFIDNKVGIVLVPFFHILFVDFIQQLQNDHGSYYGVTDSSEYECTVEAAMRHYKETVYSFVLKEKIVNMQAGYTSMDMRLLYSCAFRMVCSFNISGNYKEVLVRMKDYFEEFAEQQDFDEIKKQAASIIKINPRVEHTFKEIKEFYL